LEILAVEKGSGPMNLLNRRSLLAFGVVGFGLVVASPTFADDLTPTPTATPRGHGHANASATPHGNGNGAANASGHGSDPNENSADPKGNGAPQGANRPPHGRGLVGKILSVDTSNNQIVWTIDTPAWGQVVVNVTNAQLKAPHDIVSNKADVKADDRVAMLLTKSQSSTSPLTAQTVHVIPGKTFTHVTGTVTAVSSSSITIHTDQGDKTFSIAGGATVLTGHTTTTAASGKIQNGNIVTVVVRSADNTATGIAVHNDNNNSKSDS
jgi:hypothetical protein